MQRSLIPIARAVDRNLPRDVWSGVSDTRSARGRRHALPSLLQLLMVGLVTAMPTLRDVEALAGRLACRRRLGIEGCPSDTTLYRVLNDVAVNDLHDVLIAQVQRMHRKGQLKPLGSVGGLSLVAVDGKALGSAPVRGHPEAQGFGKGATAPYVLRSLRAVQVGSAVKPVLAQVVVPSGRAEWSGLVGFARALRSAYGSALIGCLTLDAGFCRPNELLDLSVWGIPFIVAVKGNNPNLHRVAQARLGHGKALPERGWALDVCEHVAGRRVTRSIARVDDDEGEAWGAITQLWRIRQRCERKGTVTVEDRYFATNLPTKRLTDRQALHAVRLHWGIENDSNWTMDAIWKEDSRAWSRQGRSMEALAVLRCIAVNIVRLMRCRTLRSTRRRATPYRRLLFETRLALCSPDPLWSGFG